MESRNSILLTNGQWIHNALEIPLIKTKKNIKRYCKTLKNLVQCNHNKSQPKSVERKSTMTNREFFTAIINGTLTKDVIATEAIAKLDARNAKRASTESKTQKENAPLIAKIATLLTSEPKLASTLATEMGISTQKASALVKKVEGVSVCDVKVKGKGTQKGYFFA